MTATEEETDFTGAVDSVYQEAAYCENNKEFSGH